MEKLLKRAVWLVMLVPAAYLAFTWNALPATIPMHYDLQGNVDRYGSKDEMIAMVAILTGINLLVYLLLVNIHRIDPKKQAAENKSRLQRIAFAVATFITGVLCVIIYSSQQGNIETSSRLIMSGVGLLFAVMGNYMYTIKPNYFAGFRLPWTLQDDENWRKTHLLGGKLFFVGGLLIALVCLFTTFIVSMIILFATVTGIAVITCVYSYRLYKKQLVEGGK